jgi:hypothetical protein
VENPGEEPVAGERQGVGMRGLKHSRRAPRKKEAGMNHICLAGGDEG